MKKQKKVITLAFLSLFALIGFIAMDTHSSNLISTDYAKASFDDQTGG